MAGASGDVNDLDEQEMLEMLEMHDLALKVQKGLNIASGCALPDDSGAQVKEISERLVIPPHKREQLLNELVDSNDLHELVKNADNGDHRYEKVFVVEAAKIFLRTIEMRCEICKLKPDYLFDDTRMSFLTDYVTTLSGLLSGYKHGQNGYKRLLIGAKGVGKSELLKLLQLVTIKVFGSRILCCYIEYGHLNNEHKHPEPVRVIVDELRQSVKIEDALTEEVISAPSTQPLANLLTRHKKIAVLLLDECESLFMNCANGKYIISSLFAIGGDSSGTLHCIMSGSHAKLQRLCYAKLSSDESIEFPSYTMHFNLNDSKFRKTTIAPFNTEQKFKQLCDKVGVSKCVLADDEKLGDLFLITGGLPRYVLENGKNTKFSEILISHLNNDSARKVLCAVFNALKFGQGEVRAPFNRVSPVHLEHAKLWNDVLIYDNALIDLCNSGMLSYDHSQSLIQFAHPGVYDEVLRYVSAVEHNESLVMKKPSENYKKGEEITAKYFANHCLNDSFNFGFKFTSAEYKKLDLGKTQNADAVQQLHQRLFEELYNDKDQLGVDMVVIQSHGCQNDLQYIVHRFQLKLADYENSRLVYEVSEEKQKHKKPQLTARRIVEFYNEKQNLSKSLYYKLLGTEKIELKFYLLTTELVDEEVKTYLQKENVTLLCRSDLAKIWPNHIRAHGSRYLEY